MDKEMRATIKWLESLAGRQWSMEHNRQSIYATRLFMLKNDAGLNDNVYESWGKVDKIGRYRKPRVRK